MGRIKNRPEHLVFSIGTIRVYWYGEEDCSDQMRPVKEETGVFKEIYSKIEGVYIEINKSTLTPEFQ